MTEYSIPIEEIPESDHVTVQIEGRDISIFNINGEYYAYLNWCLHQGGPVCEGVLSGTMDASFDSETTEVNYSWEREGEILNCPWHGWEYDVLTGDCLSKKGQSLPSYPVRVENEDVIIKVE